MSKLSVDRVNAFITKINEELNENLPAINPASIQNVISQEVNFDWKKIWKMMLNDLFSEISANLHLMGKLLFLAVLCALLQNLQNSFEQSTISTLSYSICFIFLSVITLNAVHSSLTIAKQAVETMVGFMEALLPILISLLAGVGAVTSAALFTPLMLFATNVASILVKDVVLPLLFLAIILECVNYLTDKYSLSYLLGLFKQCGMISLGLILVIFIGTVTINGLAGAVTDGLGLRTAKYAASTFIPVVGKMFADTVDVVMSASLFLKNTIGFIGIVVIAGICMYPLLKLLALAFIFKVSSALIQPMGDERIAKCLDSIGNNSLLIFGAVLTVAVMFFLAITGV